MACNNLMLDFETLGNKPDTAVLSLGAVVFDKDKVLAEKLWIFNVDGQLEAKRSVKMDTLIWWLTKSTKAKEVFDRSKDGLMIREFVPQFIKFCEPYSGLRVWGNGATFDVSIIENILDLSRTKPPWQFYNIRCYRTMKSCFGIDKRDIKNISHDALQDAKEQAQCLIEYWKTNPEACK